MARALNAIKQLHRVVEVPRARRVTPDWRPLLSAYLGLPFPKLPFSVRLASGPFEFRETSDVPTFWQIFFANIYRVQPTDRLILDVGANIGAFTLYALLHAPMAHVIAVEPAPDSAQRLQAVIESHGFAERCTVLRAALAAQMGTTTIEVLPASQFRRTGRAGVPVPTVTIDHLIGSYGSFDLLKLDAEGAEYESVFGASPAALHRIRRIEMEYHPWGDRQALLQHLAGQGFALQSASDNEGVSGYGMARLVNVQREQTAAVPGVPA